MTSKKNLGIPQPILFKSTKINGNGIDNEVLKSLTEEDLEKIMGVKVFGQRRKLKGRIKELFIDSNAAPCTQNVHSKGCDISPQQPSGQRHLDHTHTHTIASLCAQ